MTYRLVSASQVCGAAQQVLTDHLGEWARGTGLAPVTTWQQVPDDRSLSTAQFPAGAITSPGLSADPIMRGGNKYEATWRLAVAVFDRDDDFTATANRTRMWAALVRACLLAHRSLGIGAQTTWVGEEYAEITGTAASGTLGGCVVTFDVRMSDVTPTDPPQSPGDYGPFFVLTTFPVVGVRSLAEEL